MSNALIPGVLSFPPGTGEYTRLTAPLNAIAKQQPSIVAAPVTAEQVVACVRYASEHGLVVVPQATGHGAASDLGGDVLLLDTSGFGEIGVDYEHRSARVGAGCQWGAVNTEAWRHGLLGRAGSSPNVGVTGFTFGAGAGWLTRPWGLASGALSAVDYVDGLGAVRRAADDAPEQIDRDAIWAARGGGGVGIAVALEFDLVPVDDLWAGFQLWPIDELDAVVTAWADTIPQFGPALSTSIAVLTAPPMPLIPSRLHGQRVVHLAAASSAGSAQAQPLRVALAGSAVAAVDTWGPADAAKLGQIHLDPPGAVPAVGRARWLNDAAPSVALEVFRAAADSVIMMAEIRHVANDAPTRPGALDRPPGPYMLHAVGGPSHSGDLTGLERALDRAVGAAASADAGLAIGSWSDGRTDVPDALPAEVRARVSAIADVADPGRVLARTPLIARNRG